MKNNKINYHCRVDGDGAGDLISSDSPRHAAMSYCRGGDWDNNGEDENPDPVEVHVSWESDGVEHSTTVFVEVH
jgi:hypothetical protein